MTKALSGRYTIKLDPKGRVSLPSSLRDLIDQNHSKAQPKASHKSRSSSKSKKSFVFANGLYRGMKFIDIYLSSEWERLEQKISQMPKLKSEVQAFQRFYLSSAVTVELDSHNRLLVPMELRSFAALDEEAVIVGMGNKLELWSKPVWDKVLSGLMSDFDNVVEKISEFDPEVEKK